MSKESILTQVRAAQPESVDLPPMLANAIRYDQPIAKFMETAVTGGSRIFEVSDFEKIRYQLEVEYLNVLKQQWRLEEPLRIVSTLNEFQGLAEVDFSADVDPHTFEDVDIAIMKADLGVAENSAMWVPENKVRVLPFICQHLMLVVEGSKIVSNMHEAYEQLGLGEGLYGAFIAGPSKTADIEQSLVIGAHGPRSLTIWILP